MRLRDFLQQPPIPHHERLYLLENKHFYFRGGIDLLQHKAVPAGYHVIFIGHLETGVENLVKKPGDLISAFQFIGAANGVYSVVMGKSNFEFSDKFMAMLPPNVIQLATCNVNTPDYRCQYIPLGC
ncbi:MAG: hypothetical protein AAF556_10250, partial [Pseudomonadota bacterium]